MSEATFQPTILRANTSMTNAVYDQPVTIRQYVKSATHNLFGAAAVNLRPTRSGARCAAGFAMVVLGDLRLFAPRQPRSRITRSTEQRDTSTPLPRNLIHVLRDPSRLFSGLASRSSKIWLASSSSLISCLLGPDLPMCS